MRNNENNDGYEEYYLWLRYEEEKKKIQNIGLTPREYEREIKRICDELGI